MDGGRVKNHRPKIDNFGSHNWLAVDKLWLAVASHLNYFVSSGSRCQLLAMVIQMLLKIDPSATMHAEKKWNPGLTRS